jgi:hypothetical protein
MELTETYHFLDAKWILVILKREVLVGSYKFRLSFRSCNADKTSFKLRAKCTSKSPFVESESVFGVSKR